MNVNQLLKQLVLSELEKAVESYLEKINLVPLKKT